MLALTATAAARRQLSSLRSSDSALFQRVADRIEVIRRDPGGPLSGRVFRPDDGSVARLVVMADVTTGTDLALVWVLDEAGDTPAVRLVRVQPI